MIAFGYPPMEMRATATVPDGAQWLYEPKLSVASRTDKDPRQCTSGQLEDLGSAAALLE